MLEIPHRLARGIPDEHRRIAG